MRGGVSRCQPEQRRTNVRCAPASSQVVSALQAENALGGASQILLRGHGRQIQQRADVVQRIVAKGGLQRLHAVHLGWAEGRREWLRIEVRQAGHWAFRSKARFSPVMRLTRRRITPKPELGSSSSSDAGISPCAWGR